MFPVTDFVMLPEAAMPATCSSGSMPLTSQLPVSLLRHLPLLSALSPNSNAHFYPSATQSLASGTSFWTTKSVLRHSNRNWTITSDVLRNDPLLAGS